MKFVKKFLFLSLSVMLIFVIASCSGIKRYTTYYPQKDNVEWNNLREKCYVTNFT